MSWVVDTSVLLDVHLADPVFSRASAECLAKHVVAGLVVSPVTYIELAPAFDGDADLQEQFLAEVGVEWPALWTLRDTQAAHDLWSAHVRKRHSGRATKRPVTDLLIEAFAQRFEGLITRNPRHFATVPVIVP